MTEPESARLWRQNLRLSREDLSELIGYSASAIQDYELGFNRSTKKNDRRKRMETLQAGLFGSECAPAQFRLGYRAEVKPLFVPLKTRWFREFQSGKKTAEWRAYGPRWNERTVTVGRRIVLAHGYSGAERLIGAVTAFDKIPAVDAPAAAREIYPNAEFFARITIAIEGGSCG